MMQVRRSKIIFFLFLSITASAVGQNFEKTTATGITSERILSMARDSLGYVWLGTDEGLNRFDGIRTTNYRSNIFDTTTISSNRVWDIFVDNKNNVWVLNDRGVDLYNRTNNNFIRFAELL
jgi:ligand-binding sensor domain-containing protein